MKRVIFVFLTGLLFMVLPVMTGSASDILYTNEIKDTTTIEADLELLQLEYSDYKLNTKNLSVVEEAYTKNKIEEQFVIAVAENREDPTTITSYIYVYNALLNLSGYTPIIELQASFNDAKEIMYSYNSGSDNLSLVSEDKAAGIMKFKIAYFRQTDLTRKYNIKINLCPGEAFECVYYTTFNSLEKYRCDSFKFNSFVYITKDEVVSVILKKDQTSQLGGSVGLWCNLISGKSDFDYTVIYYYNFSSTKKIDKINTANMKWQQHTQIMYYKYPFEMPIPIVGIFADLTIHFGELQIVREEEKDEMSMHEIIPDKTKEYTFLGEKLTMNAFCTPASARLKEFGSYTDNLSTSGKKQFTEYDHSIMFTAGMWQDVRRSSGSGYLQYLSAEQVSLVSLDFTTEGEHYTAYVGDSDGPDDPKDPLHPLDPSKKQSDSWFVEFLKFIGQKVTDFLGFTNVEDGWLITAGIITLILSLVIIFLLLKFFIIPFIKSL